MKLLERFRQLPGESVILLYHRVSDTHEDPHQLAVGPDNFKAQLKAMKKILPAVSLIQIVEGIKTKKPIHGFAVTFDDGYADNFHQALPILNDLKIPATIFAVSGKIGKPEPYFWDAETAPNDRGRAMTLDELRQADGEPLIEIGAHTLSHPHLGQSTAQKQKSEIEGSKRELEKMLGHKISGLAYPFGASADDFTDQTKQITKAAGFDYACINIRGIIDSDFSDLFGLPRVLVRDSSPAEMLEQIKDCLPV